MKYIVLRTPSGEMPLLFPREVMHSYVAERFAPLEVVAAGFVHAAQGRVECHGVSIGLKIASRPQTDSELVARALADGDGGSAPPARSGEV